MTKNNHYIISVDIFDAKCALNARL